MINKNKKEVTFSLRVSTLKYIGGTILSLFALILMIYIAYPWFTEYVGSGGGIADEKPYNVILNFSLILVLIILSLYFAKGLLIDSAKEMRPFLFIVPLILILILYALVVFCTLFAFGFGGGASFRIKFAISFSPFVIGVIIYSFLKAFLIARKRIKEEK